MSLCRSSRIVEVFRYSLSEIRETVGLHWSQLMMKGSSFAHTMTVISTISRLRKQWIYNLNWGLILSWLLMMSLLENLRNLVHEKHLTGHIDGRRGVSRSGKKMNLFDQRNDCIRRLFFQLFRASPMMIYDLNQFVFFEIFQPWELPFDDFPLVNEKNLCSQCWIY